MVEYTLTLNVYQASTGGCYGSVPTGVGGIPVMVNYFIGVEIMPTLGDAMAEYTLSLKAYQHKGCDGRV